MYEVLLAQEAERDRAAFRNYRESMKQVVENLPE